MKTEEEGGKKKNVLNLRFKSKMKKNKGEGLRGESAKDDGGRRKCAKVIGGRRRNKMLKIY